jgi:two-component system chemotaxis sensor kinase CheA
MNMHDEQYEEETPEKIVEKLRLTFKDESYELLAELEAALLELEKAPQDQELIGRVFRAMHTIKGSSAACELPDVVAFTHELETFFDLVRKKKLSVTKGVIDLTLSARDQIHSLFDSYYIGGTVDHAKGQAIIGSFKALISSAGNNDTETPKTTLVGEEKKTGEDTEYKKLGEILVERGVINPEDIDWVLSSQKRFGEILVEAGLGSSDKIEAALVEQQKARELQKERQKAEDSSSIRVSTDKLDSLVDVVGELVSVQARLSQTALSHSIPELQSIAEQVERLTANLHDKTMDMRMLPIGTTFSKFKRVVRDLSQELGKEIELTTEGAETGLDKTVIERLSDPLVHLIRNSIDHGIEQPEVREAAGKPRQGTVRLSGAHSGAYVLVQIADDGAGIDREAVRAKAVEKGLLQPNDTPTDRELLSLIFTPGFSTATSVTDVSGRGVGLDVVKKTIDSLRGSVELSSNKGLGTTITLRIPLTLAIIDGLLVKIQERFFVLPLSYVKECVELTALDKKSANGRHLANVRGELVPYIQLREQFLMEGEPPAIEQVVIAETDEGRVGFVVDTVLGGHQTVIKNLGTVYKDVEGISGATILGDGAVALIIDIPKLVRMVEHGEAQLTRSNYAFLAQKKTGYHEGGRNMSSVA